MTEAHPTVSADTLEATLGEAAGVFLDELDQADATLSADGAEGATDAYLRALGLALQLGPAATEQALRRILRAVGILATVDGHASLSILAPAMVSVVDGVRKAGAFPLTPIMEAWSILAADVSAAIAEVGLALALGAEQRRGMIAACRLRAGLPEDATGGVLELSRWIRGIFPPD